MKLLIIGASGMAGHLMTTYLREQNHIVSTLAASHPFDEDTVLIDVADINLLECYLSSQCFDAVINCCGMLIQASQQNKPKAIIINSYLPHFLESFYAHSATKVIHLSTDCIFSGANGPYSENTLPDGSLFYDKTKSLGELNNAKDLTFRMSIIGPDPSPSGVGLLNWFLQQTGAIQGYSHALWNGITTLELAKAIDFALFHELNGLYHLVCPNPISKYELLLLFQKFFHRDTLTITPRDTPVSNKVLLNTRQDFSYQVSDYPVMLTELHDWMIQHKSLYPHYSLIDE